MSTSNQTCINLFSDKTFVGNDHLKSEFLSRPELFLGPNYKILFNFWSYVDSIYPNDDDENNCDKWEKIGINYRKNSLDYWELRLDLSSYVAERVIRLQVRYSLLQFYQISYSYELNSLVGLASWELLVMDKILESNKKPRILPLFIDS